MLSSSRLSLKTAKSLLNKWLWTVSDLNSADRSDRRVHDRVMQAASEGFPPKRAAQRALIQNWQAQIAEAQPPIPTFADRGRLRGTVPIGLLPRSEDCRCPHNGRLKLADPSGLGLVSHLGTPQVHRVRRCRLGRHSPQLEQGHQF